MQPPFDFDAEEHLLEKRIIGSAINLGNTDDGRAFVITSIDPSVDIDPKGMPDTTTCDVGIEKYKQSIFIRTPVMANPSELFDIEIRATGHPVAPFDVFIRPHSAEDDLSSSFTYINNQIPGTNYPSYTTGTLANRITVTTAAFIERCTRIAQDYQKLRMLNQSITVRQSAASLSDQGEVIAVQQDLNPQITYKTDGAGPAVNRVLTYGATDFPTKDNAVNLSRSYQGNSRDGCFMPLHLSLDYQEWKNMQDLPKISSPLMGTAPNQVRHLFACVTDETNGIVPMCNNAGVIFLLGIPPGTSFQCTYRAAFEGIPYAGASTTTHLVRSPLYDPVALEAFSRLTRDFVNDAYPASWNDGGTLWNWIKKAAGKIGSFVKPYVAPFLGGMAAGAPGGWQNALIKGGQSVFSQAAMNVLKRGNDQMVGTDPSSYGPPRISGNKRVRVEFI